MRLQLFWTLATDVAGRIRDLLRSRKNRRSQLRDIIRAILRGLCAGPFLTAATASPANSGPESVHGKQVSAPAGQRNGASTGRGPCSTLVSDNNSVPELEARSSAERREIWDQNFETPDPWDYASPYEQEKYQRTLALLPDEPIEQAMEIACAEGVFTSQLAPRVKSLIAVDISERALERARDRCAAHANVRFQYLDLVEDAIPGQMDLIVCSEVLYFLKDVDELRRIAEKLKSALVPGGRLVAAHAFLLADDPQNTGFDWMSHFGGKTIDRIISETPGLHREKSIVTELYRIDVYRHDIDGAARPLPDIQHLPLEAPLDPKIEKQIVWGGAYLRRSEALRSEVTDRVPILMYHRVSDTGVPELARYRVDPWAFEQQLRFLRQHGYHSVTANDLLAAIRSGEPLRGRPIMLTFDDAYRDFYETAWPLLQKYDFTADVFVVTDKVAGCADWDSSYGEPAPLMTWDEIETLEAEGIVFGSHLATHRAADCLSTVELLHEGESSRLALETRLGENVRAIAFPFGIHNRRVVNTLKLCGYEIGVTTEYGIAAMWMDPMTLPRVEVEGSDDLATFAWKIERNHTS
jgi:peptidoglycan/xylan/chitin deacetylase (PgdA/CDA1 family)